MNSWKKRLETEATIKRLRSELHELTEIKNALKLNSLLKKELNKLIEENLTF